MTIRDTQAWGFRGGLIRLQAAFNLKENIDAVVDGVTVWNSEIAFRLRGSDANTSGAWVRIQNAVLYDVGTGIRYEHDIQRLRVWNTTFGRQIARAFEDVSSAGHARPDVRNVVFVGGTCLRSPRRVESRRQSDRIRRRVVRRLSSARAIRAGGRRRCDRRG
jgi:hypothetical protein